MDSPASTPAQTVGIVDDDPTVIVMLRRILAHSGYRVQVYTSGEALLDATDAAVLDVICLDLSLPGLDGLETLARFKQTGATTPVILFTASAPDVAERARAAGAWACVSKTGGWAELRAAIAGALAHGS